MSSKSTSSNSKNEVSKASSSNQKKSKRNKNKKNKKQKDYSAVTNNMSKNLTLSYINSLNDPFENPGCRLGWGCLVPSSIVTAYVKGSVAANADGTLALAVVPNIGSMVQVANGGAAVSFNTSATSVGATDAAAISSNFSAGRIISGGIRAYPNIPMTTAPGACYVGSIPSLTVTQTLALTPNDLAASPYMKQFRAYEGGTSVIHPQDTLSFEFETRNVNTGVIWAGNDDFPSSVPFVNFVGIGNATSVFYEAVINLEVLAISQHGTTGLFTGDKVSGSTLSDYFPSKEKMWSIVKSGLASAGRYGAQAALSYATSSLASKSQQLSLPGKAFRL